MTKDNDAWTEEMSDLIYWYSQSLADLPTEPFVIGHHIRVLDPGRFYQALNRDIADGPNSARARKGALRHDLLELKQLMER